MASSPTTSLLIPFPGSVDSDSITFLTPSTPSPIGTLSPQASTTSSSSLIMTTVVPTESPVTNATSDGGSQSTPKPAPAGLIVGLILGILVSIALILFFVRRYFIRKRGQKTTATKARLSRVGGLVISGPTNFQHLGTGRVNVAPGEGGAAQISGFTVSNHQPVAGENLREDEVVWDREEPSRDKTKRKYSFDFGRLESGLSDHVDAMRKKQHAPARI